MEIVNEQRQIIKQILQNNNIEKLKKFIDDDHVSLSSLNESDFDLLLYAIECNASPPIINYIINEGGYKSLDYHINLSNEDNHLSLSPLFLAISKNRFKIADLLLKKNANINNNKIFNSSEFISHISLNSLRYLLRNGLKVNFITPDFLYYLIHHFKNGLLKLVFHHYLFNNDFILMFLKFYKNKQPLSFNQLYSILKKEKSKIMVEENMYEEATSIENYAALKLLFYHDSSDLDRLLYRINIYDMLEKAVILNDTPWVQTLLTYTPFNFKAFNSENLLMQAMRNQNKHTLKLLIISFLQSHSTSSLHRSHDYSHCAMNENDQSPTTTTTTIHYDPAYFNLILNFAIRIENIDLIQYLLESHEFESSINLNQVDINGEYPMVIAFYSDNIDIFNYLLNHHEIDGNVKNNNDTSLLSLAVLRNKYAFVRSLLTKSININEPDASGNYPLMKAISQNSLAIVMLLTEYGKKHKVDMNIINSNGDTPLTLSYRLNYQTIFRYLLCTLDINQKDSGGNSVLYYAIEQEDVETINYLIRNKVDVNAKNKLGISCFDKAMAKGSKILNLFLKGRYDNILFNIPNDQGEIPLIFIIKAKNYTISEKEEIITHLLEKGSNVNFIDQQGNSPLIYAIQKKSLPLVKLLIQHGANINYLNHTNNKTLLKYAVDLGQKDIVKYLVGRQADTYINPSKTSHPVSKDISEHSRINFDMFEYLMF